MYGLSLAGCSPSVMAIVWAGLSPGVLIGGMFTKLSSPGKR
jgi:hypothetical protein